MLNINFRIVKHRIGNRTSYWGLRDDDYATDSFPTEDEARAELLRVMIDPGSVLSDETASLIGRAPTLSGLRTLRPRLPRVAGGGGGYVIVEYSDGEGSFFLVFGPAGELVPPICRSITQAGEIVAARTALEGGPVP